MSSELVCNLCGSADLQPLTGKLRFGREANVYKCSTCSLVFIDQKSFSFPKDFYEKEYHQTYLTHVEPDALNPAVYYEKMKKANKIWADRFCEMLTGKETVLDVGCSTGHFMDLISHRASKVYGYDLNSKEIDFCISRGLDVSDQPLKARFGENSFDYISLIYVLEHIAEPRSFLLALTPLLKKGGKMIILVPNIQDALVGFYEIPEFRDFYYCIEHLYYYSPVTLRKLFDSVGLSGSIDTIQEYPLSNHLNWIYRKAPANVLASRAGTPDVSLRDAFLEESWGGLWDRLNAEYKAFLKQHGFGDRVWCTVGFDN